ncbi:MAG: hypothetical protein IJC73_09290 [Lentisphaeria bacterium]|nr:hypothetical protein [Lentisphaeria bacterium]
MRHGLIAMAAVLLLPVMSGCWSLTEEAWRLGDRLEVFREDSLRADSRLGIYETERMVPHTRLSGRAEGSFDDWRSLGDVQLHYFSSLQPERIHLSIPGGGQARVFRPEGDYYPVYVYEGDNHIAEPPPEGAAVVVYLDGIDRVKFYLYSPEDGGRFAAYGEFRSRQWTCWWGWPLKFLATPPAFCCDLAFNLLTFPVQFLMME